MNRRIGQGCLIVVLALVVAQPLLAPYNPLAQDLDRDYEAPSAEHPFGTDINGRDVFARLVAGTWHSLSVALIALVASSLIGLAVGGTAGLTGGPADRALGLGTDLFLAFPRFVILLNLAAIFSFDSALSLGLVIGLTSWMGTARMARTEVQSLRTRSFVEAARSSGAGAARVVALHLAPHLLQLVRERAGLRLAGVILLAASLDYLGIGLPADQPTWGRMIHDGWEDIETAPWVALSGIVVLSLTAVGFALSGERPGRDSLASAR